MSAQIKVEHEAVEINYNEYLNKWEFIVGGKSYATDKLSEAREKIESVIKAIALKRRKAFEPISAYSYSFEHGRITSIEDPALERYGRGCTYVRFKEDGEGGASKADIEMLLKDTESNRKIMTQIQALNAEVKRLRDTLVAFKKSDLPEIAE